MKAVLLRILDGGRQPRFVCTVCAAGFADRDLLERHFTDEPSCGANRYTSRHAKDIDRGK